MSTTGAGNTAHINKGALSYARSTNRRARNMRGTAVRLVAGFASFALMVGIGFIQAWSRPMIPQAEAAGSTRGQPTTQGVVPNWQLILNYDAVWPNGGLREDATYWTADVTPSSSTSAAPVYIIGMQYPWADDMNTFQTMPVMGVKRVPTKAGDGSTTTSLNYNNWQSTAMARIGGTMNGNGAAPLTIYFWDNAGGYSQGGLSCGSGSGYVPVIRVTSEDPNMYWACMPIANSTGSMGGFNRDGTSPIRLGNSGAYGGEADQYTGNIYVSSAFSLDARVDSEDETSRDANDRGTLMFTVWNPEKGTYTLSGSIQPGDWTDGMSTVPQERVALLRDVNGSNNFSAAYASADFVMDSDGDIYVYVAESGTVPSSNNGAWNAKILRVEPARDPATGNIVQGTASNPWRYYVTNKVVKDPAYPGARWSSPTSLYGNAFINGQMLLTASANVNPGSGVSLPSTATAGNNGTTSLIKIDPLTNMARPVWSTNNVAPLIAGTTHDSASPQGAQVISGHLYNDVDGDGTLDIDANGHVTAPGVYNQRVALYDSNGKLLAVHNTDTSGRYDFIVSGKEESTYYIRPVQVQIPVSGGAMVNAAQTWALGSQEDGTNSAGANVTNTVAVQCYNADGGQVTTDAAAAGAACFGALNPASADPAPGEIGSISDPATWLTYATAHLHTAEQVPTADFGFTVHGSYGDSAAGPTMADVPAHINTDPAVSVWLGGNPGAYTGPVTDNSHTGTDDGVFIASYDGVKIPLQDATLAATGSYTVSASLSGNGTADAKVAGWVNDAGAVWDANPAWRPDVSGDTAAGTFRFQPDGAVSGTPSVQFRAQVSTTAIAQPTNTSGQYYSTDATTGGANWTTPGEIEDYTFTVADSVYRPAVKTTGGSAIFTVDGQPLVGDSAAFTLGTATVVNPGITKTITADAPDSTWNLTSATVRRTSDGTALAADVTNLTDTRTQVSWPVALGDDVRVELVYGKAADPGRSQLTIDPNTTIVGTALTATATIKDADGNLLRGQQVDFTNISDTVVLDPAQCTTDETTGSCSATITSTVAGTYTDEISATVQAGSSTAGIAGSPKTVVFTPGKPDPNTSSLAVAPAGPLEVGTADANTYTATALAKDVFGNTVPGQRVHFTVTNADDSAVSPSTKLSADHCDTGNTGTCNVTLTSTKAGTYLVNATIQNPDDPTQQTGIQSSPATVVYVAKEVCVVEKGCEPQPGVTTVTHVQVTRDNALNDGQATDEITAYTYDEWGNEVSAEVHISTTDSALKLAGTGTIFTDAVTGRGTLTATSLVGGPHTATASIDGTDLSEEHGSPLTLNFTDQPATTGNSALVLSSTRQEVGTVVTATVTARNANGTPVSGQEIGFAWDGPVSAVWTDGVTRCTTDPEGTCSVSFTDTKPETVSIHARLGSGTEDIGDSPQNTTFTVGPADLTTSEISASPKTVAANGTDFSTVTVTLRDEYGNQLPHPTDVVTVSSTLGSAPAVTNNDNGTYTTTLTSRQSGQATLSFTVNGEAATGEKSTDTVTFTTTAFSAANSSWTVAAATTATAADGLDPRYPIANADSTGGDHWTAVLSARDSSGNAMKDLDTTKIAFAATGLPTVAVSPVVNNTDGTYTVTISSRTMGDAVASVTYDGSAKVGPAPDRTLHFQSGKICMPSTNVTCSEDPAKQTRAEVDPNGAQADGLDTDGIVVYAFDKDGNPVEATFSLLSLDRAVLASHVVTTDPTTGRGSTTATSTSPDPQRVQVSVNGTLLPSLPQGMLTLSYTAGGVSETNSTLSVAPTSQNAGQNVTATVTARDGSGLALAGIPITVTVDKSAAMIVNGTSVTSHDCVTNTSGTCQVTITDLRAEDVTVTATVQKNGAPAGISGSPTTVAFIDTTPPPVVSAANSQWTLTPTTTAVSGSAPVANGNSTGGDYWTGVLTVRDQNNAPMSSLDVAKIVFTPDPSTANVRVSPVTNTGDGTYTVNFTSAKAGSPTVSVSFDGGAKIGATPGQDTPTDQAIPFQAGPVCIPTASQECPSTYAEVDPNGAIANGTDTDRINVHAADKDGNPVAATFQLVSTDPRVNLAQSSITTPSATGTGFTTATSTVPGNYPVTVTITGIELAQSPLTVSFGAASPNPPVAGHSTLELDRTSQETGKDVTATVTARDADNNPVVAAAIVVSVDQAATIGADKTKTHSCRTDAEGVCTVTLTDTVPEQVTVRATLNDNGSAVDILGSPKTVDFFAGETPISYSNSAWALTPTTTAESGTDPVANGNSTGHDYWTGVLTARDQNNLPMANLDPAAIRFAANPPADVQISSVENTGDGTYTVRFTSTKAGNPTASVTYGTAPAKFGPVTDPTIAFQPRSAPAAPSVTSPKPGAQINDPTPDVVGTAEPGSTVTVKDKDTGTTLCTATADANGDYACTSWELGDGPHTLSVTAADSSGNTSAATQVPIWIDTIAPQPPAIDRANGTEISGRAEPGSIITVTVPGVTDPVTTTADRNGSWLIPTPVGAQDGTVRATASDPVGNTSPETTAPIDVTAPAPPVVDATPTQISGTAEAGSTVTITVPGVTGVAITTADDSGRWSIPTPAGARNGTVSATATDQAGNVSQPGTGVLDRADPVVPAPIINVANATKVAGDAGSTAQGRTITVTFPDGRTGATVGAGDGSWTIPTPANMRSGDVTATATDPATHVVSAPSSAHLDADVPDAPRVDTANGAEVSGGKDAAEAGSTVKVVFPDGTVRTTVANPDGSYRVDTPAGMPGLGIVTVTVTDPAGNVSAPTQKDLDTQAPDKPTIDKANAAEISGTAEAGSTVKVTVPGVPDPVRVRVGSDGKWKISTPAGAQEGTIRATATDPAGNTSPEAVAHLDLTPPDAPSVATANSTKVSGTAEPGSTVTVVFPGGTKLTATADSDTGAYFVTTPQGMPSGTVTVTASDPAGNVSAPTVRDLDTQAPDAPVIDHADATEISGTAEPGSTVTVKVPGVDAPIAIVVGDDGKWRIETPAGATDGAVRATATDPAGNVSGETTRQIDVTAPSKPLVNPSNGTEVTGTADPGSMISITDENGNDVACKNPDGSRSTSVMVDVDGKFACVPDKVLEPGSSITVVAKDASGLDSDPVMVKIGAVAVEVAYAERHRLDSQVVTGHRFNAGERVCLVVHSDPLDLGCQAADDEGGVTFTFQVPEVFDLGVHTVTLSGQGSKLSASTSFTVVETVSVATGGTARHADTVPGGVPIVLPWASVIWR